MEKVELNLEKKHPDYDLQFDNWGKFNDCFKGGEYIQNADDDKYLFKRPNEQDKRYDTRKKRAVYYNKPEQIISTFQGHIWRKSPDRTLLPTSLQQYINNINRQGTTANAFFSYVSEWAQVLGLYYVLVDYSYNPDIEKQTQAEEKKSGLRSYFVKIHPLDLLDWSFTENQDGSKSLAYIVIREDIETENIPFKTRNVKTQYRLIYRDHTEIWENVKVNNKETPTKISGDIPNTLGEIPLVPFYSKEISFGVGRSALHNIVDLAIELYNKHSDKDHAEFMSAFPFPFFKGFDTKDQKIVVGEGWGVASENPQSDVKLVEFSGNSIEALRNTETNILQEMFDLALKQIRTTSRQREAAEAKRLDRLDATSDIQARAIGFSESETKCWEYMAKWLKQDFDNEKNAVKYNLDFDLRDMKADLLGHLLTMRTTHDLSRETLWHEMKRGELLDSSFDPEKEALQIEKDQNSLGMPGFNNSEEE